MQVHCLVALASALLTAAKPTRTDAKPPEKFTEPANIVHFKLLPDQDSDGAAATAASVAAMAGLKAPRRVFRPSGIHEARHKAAGLHLWYEAEAPAPVKADGRRSLNDGADAAAAALARIRIASNSGPRQSVARSSKEPDDKRIAVATAQIRPQHKLRQAPNDPSYSNQPHFDSIGMPSAWSITGGDSSVVVAVVDSGMDMDHPECAAVAKYPPPFLTQPSLHPVQPSLSPKTEAGRPPPTTPLHRLRASC